jgi:hypothetical protein
MTSGKLVRLPPAPELTDGPDLRLRRPLPDDVDDMVAQSSDAEFQCEVCSNSAVSGATPGSAHCAAAIP